jgi:ferredoxin, 2Fe-2S|tara:strand:- start:253 stop:612 length:360 start_codon:yes stop_codon:yes gene_type:complete
MLALFYLIPILSLMPKITYISHEGKKNTVEVDSGLSVMEGAIQNNVEGIDADCGGSMACATCHVYVPEKWFDKLEKPQDAEQDMIDMAYEPKKNSRLSCQIIVSPEIDGIEINTPLKQT